MLKVMKKMDLVIEIIGCVCFAGMIICLMANVFCDYVFGRRFAEIDEVLKSFFVWVTYVGAGMLYKNGEQMQIDFLADKLPEKLRKTNDLFVDLFTLLISGVVCYYSWTLSIRSMVKTTAVAHIPYAIIDFALVVGFFTMFVYIIMKLICKISCNRR